MNVLTSILLFGMPGGWEWFIIIFFVLLLFGAKKIPELARGLGRGIREFKDATREIKDEIEESSKKIDDAVKKS
jgi:sec-independent protein translocase protein TatA